MKKFQISNFKFQIIPGFTLIEILVSVTILSIMAIFIVQSIISVIRANAKAELLREIKQNGDYAMDVLTRKIQNATGITCDSSSRLTVVTTDENGHTTSAVYNTAGADNDCRLTENGTPITSANITLDRNCANPNPALFSCSGATVTVDFILKQTGASAAPADIASMPFKSTVNVRSQ
ncbi:hypothetical protein A2154_04975 [Candidatus Gottesmanbacteria bacterium RBG_16_43_7]|uniref:Prepilin-type N-terminal cleavage/methylation domain-containing protein n=1 Tax=Candidatus Gottesmanbacteria bacterium RBG_16_43_7 TaxID=1798373 RepID=A0A1F5ZD76_9BACT|nr:MAG: hypothetical protein A2154_04975 [Candidatus Gottesmanbacteria bacterium RBG_16_43_7]